jgi:DNA-directed RNA polymerase subunit N (RpoN/RPB10)
MEWTDNELQEWKKNINDENSTSINPKTKRKIKNNGNIYKSLEKEFEKRLHLNINDKNDNKQNYDTININDNIPYPFTMPIMCFTCNTVISRIEIFNKLWKIHNNNIDNNMRYIDEQLKINNIEKIKWINKIKNNWWQKIGGFEKINDEIKLDFTISDNEWKSVGIENLCCRRMIYTHEENPLFVYGPSSF